MMIDNNIISGSSTRCHKKVEYWFKLCTDQATGQTVVTMISFDYYSEAQSWCST